jgi:hypothetical protein
MNYKIVEGWIESNLGGICFHGVFLDISKLMKEAW